MWNAHTNQHFTRVLLMWDLYRDVTFTPLGVLNVLTEVCPTIVQKDMQSGSDIISNILILIV